MQKLVIIKLCDKETHTVHRARVKTLFWQSLQPQISYQ